MGVAGHFVERQVQTGGGEEPGGLSAHLGWRTRRPGREWAGYFGGFRLNLDASCSRPYDRFLHPSSRSGVNFLALDFIGHRAP